MRSSLVGTQQVEGGEGGGGGGGAPKKRYAAVKGLKSVLGLK